MNVCAFSRANPFGARFNAIHSSDIGHFDVIDMRDPLPEAWELVEDGPISEDNFSDFTFAKRCGCGARRTRGSSMARSSPRKPLGSSPNRKFSPRQSSRSRLRGGGSQSPLRRPCSRGRHALNPETGAGRL
jgi:hypothetical protein